MSDDLESLRAAGMKPTTGDIRCVALGHITRMAAWRLKATWNSTRTTAEKFAAIRQAMNGIATVDEVQKRLEGAEAPLPLIAGDLFVREERGSFDAVAF
jgi:hypothetical protein